MESAKSIDAIVSSLLDKVNVDEAVKNTSDIEFDASVVFLRYLSDLYENQSFEYLKSLIQQSPNENIYFNAYQFLSENFELDPSERLRLSSFLDGEGLQIMFSDEVIGTLQEELYSDPAKYELWSDVDSLSSHSRIDDVWVELISFSADFGDPRIEFRGEMMLEVDLSYGTGRDASSGSGSYPGKFSGYFDEHGIYIESATIDTSSPDYSPAG